MEEPAIGRAGALVPDERLVDARPMHKPALQRIAAVIFGDRVGAVVGEPRRAGAGHLIKPHARIVAHGRAVRAGRQQVLARVAERLAQSSAVILPRLSWLVLVPPIARNILPVAVKGDACLLAGRSGLDAHFSLF